MILAATPAGALGYEWIRFSGYVWTIRRSEEPGGPLGNRFAGEGRSVFLNPDGSLTLALSGDGETWYGGELELGRSLGYGTYTFRLRTKLSDLDPNVVLGLFCYSQVDRRANDEVDIEFSAWGNQDEPVRGQFVVQPYDLDGHLALFDLRGEGGGTSYSFDWAKERIEFLAWEGYGPPPPPGSPGIIASWTYAQPKAMPDPRKTIVLMNLYLAGKPAPAGSGLGAVTIDGFEFRKAR